MSYLYLSLELTLAHNRALMENGYLNDRASLSSLVWHKESNTV